MHISGKVLTFAVFFMVLDLRLVKIGCRETINFFCTQASAAGNLEGGKGALPDRNGASINIICVMNRLRSSVWIKARPNPFTCAVTGNAGRRIPRRAVKKLNESLLMRNTFPTFAGRNVSMTKTNQTFHHHHPNLKKGRLDA